MKVLLVICIQVIIFCQISESKILVHENDFLKETQFNENAIAQEFSRRLEVYDQKHLRSLSDLWQSIKNTAVNTWNHIKNIANKTKEKVLQMLEQLKGKIDQIQSRFEERLNELKRKVKEMIENAVKAGENIKECVQAEKEAIDKIAIEILKNVTTCISENMLHLVRLERTLTIEFDGDDFERRMDIKLNLCIQNGDAEEECLHGIREDLFTEVEAVESEVLQVGTQTRNAAEDIMNTIIICTTDGLIAASANITMEAINIIKCATEESDVGTNYSYKLE